MTQSRPTRIAAALFLITAVLFVIGVSTEPDSHDETTEVDANTSAANGEVGEGEAAHDESEEEGEEAHDESTEAGESHGENGEEETVLGIDVESPAAIALAVIVSIALAAALLFRPTRTSTGSLLPATPRA